MGNSLFRVCHVTSAHGRYDVRIFHKECKSLANKGFEVVLLVNDDIESEFIDGVHIVSTRRKLQSRFKRMVQSKRYIRKIMLEINASIYHFHDPELLPEAIWIKKKGKKVIFDFHEDVAQQILYKEWIPRLIRKKISFLYSKYEKQCTKKFDALIAATPKVVEQLQKTNPKTAMVTNFPILDIYKEKKPTLKKRAICFAGGISPQWKHENIITAIGNLEDAEYILAGRGDPNYIEKLTKLPGWEKVRFLGQISMAEVQEIYAQSMVGMAVLSYNTQVGKEGNLSNTKLFEFMAAGIPFICSNSRIWSEIVNKYHCGFTVEPDDILGIQSKIIQLLDDRELAQEMGDNGKNAAAEVFNWDSQAEVLLKLYSAIANED